MNKFGLCKSFGLAIWTMILAISLFVLPVEAANKTTESVVSSSSLGGGSSPDVAWGTNSYGVVFDDSRAGNNEIYFSQLDKNGIKIGQDIRITNNPGNSWEPKIGWDGHNFGIFWWDAVPGGDAIFFAKVSPSGDILTPNKMIAPEGVSVSAVWNKDNHEYGVTWYADNIGAGVAGADFTRLDSNGDALSPIITLNSDNQGGPYGPRIATSGKDYAVGWSDRHGCGNNSCPAVLMASINADGEKVGLEHQLTVNNSDTLWSMTWNGKNYALVAEGDNGPELITATGPGDLVSDNVLSGPFQTPRYLGLTWDANHYVLSFVDTGFSGAGNADPILAQYDKSGAQIGDFTRANSGPGLSWLVSKPVKSGDSIAVVWLENLYDPSQNISFSKINL